MSQKPGTRKSQGEKVVNDIRWLDAQMALRWTAAGMLEAGKGFRRLKAYVSVRLRRA